MRFPLAAAALVLVAVVTAAAATPVSSAGPLACARQPLSPAYAAGVRRALAARRDVWGEALIARPNGPTYGAVRRLLKPLLFARSKESTLTASGVYYLPFAQPLGVRGAQTVALHVADGSEILSQTAKGPSLTVYVGPEGHERYGSCLARLSPARLADGFLPILETSYVDAGGTRYRQESFSVRGLGTGELVSFVRVTADARNGTGAVVQLVPKGSRRGARVAQGTMRLRVAPGESGTIDAGWLVPYGGAPVAIDDAAFDAARERLVEFWTSRLGAQPTYDVPEPVVVDAERSLLIQDLALTWRYSVGNQYEEFSFAEALDAAEVMAEYGLPGVTKEILRSSLSRLDGGGTSNWRAGEKLTAAALYYRLSGDRAYLDQATPMLSMIVAGLGRQIRRPHGGGLLRRERFSSDVAARVYGLHAQAAVWQGLNAIADAWRSAGRPAHARTARGLATVLGRGLHRAVRRSAHRLKDGSLFVPAALLAHHKPFDAVTASRPGSYWNLVVPYALSSGFFTPGGRDADGILDYMLGHGSRLLGLVRAGAYSLYGKARYPVSGTDQVYGLNVARFLADNDRPDQLVLSLYGMLGASMTPNTFVSGEAATVAPLRGAAYRSMYMPPNTASNSAFLETLRLMLVHETRDKDGTPVGLELAYSTPRPWLGDGKTIAVNEAPTSFGPLSYDLHRDGRRITGTVTVPSRHPPHVLRLRLRLPHGVRLGAVRIDGRRRPVDRRTGTVDLSGLRGSLNVVAMLSR
ncbi:MAG TPA: hypothetical protein VFB35_04990 [Gaiellaceae bacterium]|nr:hypothetical protein [Gaiellaceae bacterium]